MKRSVICVLVLVALLTQSNVPARAQAGKIDLKAEPLKTLMNSFQENSAVSLSLNDGSKIRGKIISLDPAGVEINSAKTHSSIWLRYSDIRSAATQKSVSAWLKKVGEYAGLAALATIALPFWVALNILSLLISGQPLSDC